MRKNNTCKCQALWVTPQYFGIYYFEDKEDLVTFPQYACEIEQNNCVEGFEPFCLEPGSDCKCECQSIDCNCDGIYVRCPDGQECVPCNSSQSNTIQCGKDGHGHCIGNCVQQEHQTRSFMDFENVVIDYTFIDEDQSNKMSFPAIKNSGEVFTVDELDELFSYNLFEIIGEGTAATKIALGVWVGDLTTTGINPLSGFEVFFDGRPSNLIIEFPDSAAPVEFGLLYELHSGQNFIGWPYNYSGDLNSVLNYEVEPDIVSNITGIIGEGQASSNIGDGQWVGSLDTLLYGHSYWVNLTNPYDGVFWTVDYEIYGCTDPNALRCKDDQGEWMCYADSETQPDDEPCLYSYIYCNSCSSTPYIPCNGWYRPSANVDDGSCIYLDDLGCTNSQAYNYDPDALFDDNTCVLPLYGCTDPEAHNYDPDAGEDDGSCVYHFCPDITASNYVNTQPDNWDCLGFPNGTWLDCCEYFPFLRVTHINSTPLDEWNSPSGFPIISTLDDLNFTVKYGNLPNGTCWDENNFAPDGAIGEMGDFPCPYNLDFSEDAGSVGGSMWENTGECYGYKGVYNLQTSICEGGTHPIHCREFNDFGGEYDNITNICFIKKKGSDIALINCGCPSEFVPECDGEDKIPFVGEHIDNGDDNGYYIISGGYFGSYPGFEQSYNYNNILMSNDEIEIGFIIDGEGEEGPSGTAIVTIDSIQDYDMVESYCDDYEDDAYFIGDKCSVESYRHWCNTNNYVWDDSNATNCIGYHWTPQQCELLGVEPTFYDYRWWQFGEPPFEHPYQEVEFKIKALLNGLSSDGEVISEYLPDVSLCTEEYEYLTWSIVSNCSGTFEVSFDDWQSHFTREDEDQPLMSDSGIYSISFQFPRNNEFFGFTTQFNNFFFEIYQDIEFAFARIGCTDPEACNYTDEHTFEGYIGLGSNGACALFEDCSTYDVTTGGGGGTQQGCCAANYGGFPEDYLELEPCGSDNNYDGYECHKYAIWDDGSCYYLIPICYYDPDGDGLYNAIETDICVSSCEEYGEGWTDYLEYPEIVGCQDDTPGRNPDIYENCYEGFIDDIGLCGINSGYLALNYKPDSTEPADCEYSLQFVGDELPLFEGPIEVWENTTHEFTISRPPLNGGPLTENGMCNCGGGLECEDGYECNYYGSTNGLCEEWYVGDDVIGLCEPAGMGIEYVIKYHFFIGASYYEEYNPYITHTFSNVNSDEELLSYAYVSITDGSETIYYDWRESNQFYVTVMNTVYGCMDEEACNYNPDATDDDGSCTEFDCNDECGGLAITQEYCLDGDGDGLGCPGSEVDLCSTNPITETGDCEGEGCYVLDCSESSPENCDCPTDDPDDCGVCSGGNLDKDCMGICFGEAFLDDCDVCSSGTSEHFPNSDQDDCGICFGENYDCVGLSIDCNCECFGEAEIDEDCFGECVGGSTDLEYHFCYGCIDPEAECGSYDPDATIDDGSCIYVGITPGYQCDCMGTPPITVYPDSDADGIGCCSVDGVPQGEDHCLYDIPPGWVEICGEYDEYCSCLYNWWDDCGVCGGSNQCIGCTNPYAINFSPIKTIDDGTCEYDWNRFPIIFKLGWYYLDGICFTAYGSCKYRTPDGEPNIVENVTREECTEIFNGRWKISEDYEYCSEDNLVISTFYLWSNGAFSLSSTADGADCPGTWSISNFDGPGEIELLFNSGTRLHAEYEHLTNGFEGTRAHWNGKRGFFMVKMWDFHPPLLGGPGFWGVDKIAAISVSMTNPEPPLEPLSTKIYFFNDRTWMSRNGATIGDEYEIIRNGDSGYFKLIYTSASDESCVAAGQSPGCRSVAYGTLSVQPRTGILINDIIPPEKEPYRVLDGVKKKWDNTSFKNFTVGAIATIGPKANLWFDESPQLDMYLPVKTCYTDGNPIPPAPPFDIGDVNMDREIDINDITLINNYLNGEHGNFILKYHSGTTYTGKLQPNNRITGNFITSPNSNTGIFFTEPLLFETGGAVGPLVIPQIFRMDWTFLPSGNEYSTSITLNKDGHFETSYSPGHDAGTFTYIPNTLLSSEQLLLADFNQDSIVDFEDIDELTDYITDAEEGVYGCFVESAENYNPNAVNGCDAGVFPNGVEYPIGTLFCCDFNCYDLVDVGGTGMNSPYAFDIDVSVEEEVTTDIELQVSDADCLNEDVTFIFTPQSVDFPIHGTVNWMGYVAYCSAGDTGTTFTVQYTPDTDYNGPDEFIYHVHDGYGLSNRATVSITVGEASTVSLEEDCATPDDPITNQENLVHRSNYINQVINSRDIGEHYAIPLVFYDVYGGHESSMSSYCELLGQEECECKAYHSTQILSEQYLPGNISFYRACYDETGTILSEQECNRGDGTLFPFVDTPDEYIDKNRLNSNNHTSVGWNDFNYYNNVINIYVAESFISGGEPVGTNGFAQRGWYGDDKHRGIALRQDILFEKAPYSGPGYLHMYNWSTFGHELGHTFNGYHLYQGWTNWMNYDEDPSYLELVNLLNCTTEGDLICDTEAQAKHSLNRISYPYFTEDFGDGYGPVLHKYCSWTGADGDWDTDNDILYISGNYPVYDIDATGRLWGTRDLDWAWDETEQAYVVTDVLAKVKAHHTCSYDETCNTLDFHGTNTHNLLSSANISHCRNLGCYNTSEGKCTPLPAYTFEQFIAWRYDIEYGLPDQDYEGENFNYTGLIGCTDRNDINWAPNWVINDESFCEGELEVSETYLEAKNRK